MDEFPDILEELEGEDPFSGWRVGYRSWKLGFREDDAPRLFSPSYHPDRPWEPGPGGEIESDFVGTPKEFEQTRQGLYSIDNLDKLRQSYGREGVVGAIIPYGTIIHGDYGTRSTKAAIKHLYRGGPDTACRVCQQPARTIIRQLKDSDIALCKTCRPKFDELVDRLKGEGEGFQEYTMDDLLEILADVYESKIEKWPY